MLSFYDKLDLVREGVGLSRAAFSRELINGTGLFPDLASGRVKAISHMGMERLFWNFGVNPDWWFNEEGSMFKPGTKYYRAEDDPDQKQIVPLLGSIAAGLPSDMVGWQGEYVKVPPAMVRGNYKFFALRVRGDSMLGASIEEDDIAVLRQVSDWRAEIKNRDIVAAAVDGEATLKTFFRDGDNILLHPENPNYQDILLRGKETSKVLGVFVGLLRFAPERE